jgi:hypothetical protein
MKDYKYGASLSVLACEGMGLDPGTLLKDAIKDLGVRRFRLMTYWDKCEKSPGKYDFAWVDKQIKEIAKYDGEVTLCLGFKQPRWPEGHQPEWAKKLDSKAWEKALMNFLEASVRHFRNNKTITSWQLENEALNRGFGLVDNYDRKRLINELGLVKKLDSTRPVIMSLSNSYGLPFRKPRPDLHGFSIYLNMVTNGKRSYLHMPFWAVIIRTILIHFSTTVRALGPQSHRALNR